MRTGLTVSLIGHALILGWGLWQLPGAKPFDAPAVDALPVDLVTISDVTKLSEGSKTAKKGDTASQGKAAPPIPRPDSQHIGNAPKDLAAPPTDKATDTAAAKEAVPPPPPPKAPPPPEPAPEPPKEPPKTEPPKAEPPKSDTGELASAEKPPEKPAEKPAEATKPAPLDVVPPKKPKPPTPTDATDDGQTKTDSKTKSTAKTDKPSDAKPDKFDANQLAALLNKIDPSGGGGKASDKEASLGSENATGSVGEMTESELDALTAAVQKCFNPPVGAAGIEKMVVPLVVEFTPDGDLAGPPRVKSIPSDPSGQAVADAAVRAVQRCAPYPFLPPDKYATWRVVNMNFSPPSSY